MHITYIHIVIIKNKDYAPGLAMGRRGVSRVSRWWLQDLLLHENLLLVLLDNLLKLMLDGGHKLYQLVLNMHAMMMMQRFSI